MSFKRLSPCHITFSPGFLSLLRPKNPPNLASIKTISFTVGGASGGYLDLRVKQHKAFHSMAFNILVQDELGFVRPIYVINIILHAIME